MNNNKSVDEKIKFVDERVEQIQKDSTITLMKFIHDDTTLAIRSREYIDDGLNGKVSYYLKDDTIVRICHSGSHSFGSGYTIDYYFHINQLIFVHKWTAIASNGATKPITTDYYIENKKLIKPAKDKANANEWEVLSAEAIALLDLLEGSQLNDLPTKPKLR